MKIAINGYFYTRRMDGMYRFSHEILVELDKIVNKGKYYLIVPEYANKVPEFTNIEVVKYGSIKNRLWNQFSFGIYAAKHNMITFDTNNTTVLWRPGICCILDLLYVDMADTFNTSKGRLSRHWSAFNYKIASRKCNLVFTISEFSKSRIVDKYKVPEEKVKIIPCGWQHIRRVTPDFKIFEKYPQLKKENYYFTLASMSKYKNFDWICAEARVNTNSTFAIAGGAVSSSKYSEELKQMPNVVVLGFISDEEVVALMKNCKAFIFPSKYEGFGMPPMEAMAHGAKAIVSTAASLPEVYGNTVYYIDPNKTDYILDDVMKASIDSPEMVLEKYSWAKAAEIINREIEKYYK